MATDARDLPPHLRLLWGREHTTLRGDQHGDQRGDQRGNRPGLSLDRVVAAAIALADRSGLDASSMAAIARELGFTTMSLYRHVSSKDDLLRLMVDEAGGDPPDLSGSTDWRSGLEAWAWAQLALLRRHPWILDVPVTGPPMSPGELAWMDRALQAMAGTGMPEGAKVGNLLLLTAYIRSAARFAVEMPAADPSSAESETTYGTVLAQVVDAQRLPALARALEAGVFDEPDSGFADADFDFGLQRVLDGIGVLARSY